MEDLYRILRVTPTATTSELKKSYQELVLQFHPDKACDSNIAASSNKFIEVNKAYKILSDHKLRKQYDVKWKERCLAQTYPIQDTVEFEEFEEILDESSSESIEKKDSGCGMERAEHVCSKEDNKVINQNKDKRGNYIAHGEESKGSKFEKDIQTEVGNLVSEQSKPSYCESDRQSDAKKPVLEKVYVYPCRCGGNYVLMEVDVQLKFDFVCCDSCSLTVQVIYQQDQ